MAEGLLAQVGHRVDPDRVRDHVTPGLDTPGGSDRRRSEGSDGAERRGRSRSESATMDPYPADRYQRRYYLCLFRKASQRQRQPT